MVVSAARAAGLAAAVLICGAVGILCVLTGAGGLFLVAVSLGTLYACASALLHPVASIARDVLHPVTLTKALFALGYYPGLLAAHASDTVYPEVLAKVAVYGIYVLLMADIAALVVPGPRALVSRDTPSPTDRQSMAPVLLVIFGLGWAWRGYALTNGLMYGTHLATALDVRASSNAIGTLNALPLYALFGYAALRGRRGIIWSLVPLEVVWMLLGGSKAAVLFVVLPLLLVEAATARFRATPWRLSVLAFGGIALIYVTFVSGHLYRAGVQRALDGDRAVPSSIPGPTTVVSGLVIDGRPAGGSVALRIAERISIGGNLARLLAADARRPLDRWGGASYLPMFVWFIPRAAWPEKPGVSVGHWFGREVLGWSQATRSEAAITVFGDAYMNFGNWGLVAIPFLYFAIVTFVYAWLLGRRRPWALFVLAAVYTRLLMGVEQNLANAIVGIQHSALIALSLYGVAWVVSAALPGSARRAPGLELAGDRERTMPPARELAPGGLSGSRAV